MIEGIGKIFWKGRDRPDGRWEKDADSQREVLLFQPGPLYQARRLELCQIFHRRAENGGVQIGDSHVMMRRLTRPDENGPAPTRNQRVPGHFRERSRIVIIYLTTPSERGLSPRLLM